MEIRKLGKPSGQSMKIDFKKGLIKAKMATISFLDHDHNIAYLPALDLSGYGDSKEEAFQMLNELLETVFDTFMVLTERQVHQELSKLGWHKDRYRKRKYIGAFVDAKGILNNFDLPNTTEVCIEMVEVSG